MTNILQKNWLIARLLEKKIGSSVKSAKGYFLDIGCGDQPYRKLLNGSVNLYVGIDLPGSPLIDNKLDLFATAEALPFREESFDTILCTEVLQYVPEPKKAIQEICRVLKKKGILLLTTTQMWHVTNAPYDHYRFTEYGLEYLIASAGMKVKSKEVLGGFWLRIGLKFCYFMHRFNKSSLLNLLIGFFLIAPQLFFLLMDRLFFDPKDVINHFFIVENSP